jgi:putative DNA-invertase from lambdoid prophage Rac
LSDPVRVALYLRVSSNRQELTGQERDLREFARARGWVVAEVYSEKVTATGKLDRAEYARLFRDAADPARPWTDVVVWSLDRFSREVTFTKATQAILDLEKFGVRFRSLKEPSLDTPEDGMPSLGRNILLALLPVIAAFESARRSERVRLAMSEIRAGRRRTRTGLPPGRKWRVTPEKAETIRRLRAKNPPSPYSAIAQQVALPLGTCRRVASQLARGLDPFLTRAAPKPAASGSPPSAPRASLGSAGARPETSP